MIELVIRYDDGRRSTSKFRDIREYTDWLIAHPSRLDSLGVRGYDVRELDRCLSHDWKYVPPADRTYLECNFKCGVCDAGIEVSHATLDGLYIDNPSMMGRAVSGGWCAPDDAYCHCGQVFDENHDRALCRDIMPISDAGLILISNFVVERGGVRIDDQGRRDVP